MNVLERKKLKSCNHGITEFWSFLVRYRRTYILKKRTRELDESERAGKEKYGKGFLGA